MAASTTGAAFRGFQPELCTPLPLVSVNTSPVWLGDGASHSTCSTSPASELSSELEEEDIKRKIYEIKRQFHNGRFLLFRYLPKGTTEEVSGFVPE